MYQTSVAEPVHSDSDPRIQIKKNSDPDTGDPKKTGSGSDLDMFLMFSKINHLFIAFSNANLMPPKMKNKKII